ncbi:hypothetical protein SAMN05443270_1482 [Lacrimispora sphenoides]|uniref:hypothetical protein n=1 Tax=Lacrimispora sphenoides TaxID=29370 RepID=UPI0008BE2CE5|nr:hypothetical protein [Lacrimispora sphenoides]SET80112.1 hypothetical protein SAMN05443270_1482 [Lacrimispora sphenoides]
MGLKTDYKDAMFDGQRRYRLIPNEDGTYSLPDETTYTQKGDRFGANDINATNKAINQINHVTEVTLTVAGWEGSAPPYTQMVAAPGAAENSEAIAVSALADGATEATQKAYIKAYGIVTSGTAFLGDGAATFKVYKKPATDIKIGLKGV